MEGEKYNYPANQYIIFYLRNKTKYILQSIRNNYVDINSLFF